MSVYFAQAADYIKIGYSRDPIARATTITRLGVRPDDLPFDTDVDLLGWIPGDVWRERALHVEHLDRRVAGEWFRISRDYAQGLIWADPAGVDLHRMTATAAMLCHRRPGLRRADIEAAGVRVMAPSGAEAHAAIDGLLAGRAS